MQNDLSRKKQLFYKKTPKVVELIIYEIVHRDNDQQVLSSEIIQRLQRIEQTSLELQILKVAHLSQVLQVMIRNDRLPQYLEQAFLQLLDEILLTIQTPTQFQFRLPKLQDENVLQIVKQFNTNGQSKTVLIIDHDLLFLNKMARLFTEAGFSVLKSHKVDLALQICEETLPDCIIFQLDFISKNPEKFIKELKLKIGNYFVPLIAISSKHHKSISEKVKFEIDDLVEKPFLMDDLLLIVMRLMERARQMKKQVNIDELTGIYSRKYIMDRLAFYLSSAKEKEFSHTLAIFDLDYFKHVNDRYGHPVGDQVLIEFANFVSRKIRNTDIFARYGGEEFIVLFPRTTTKDAWKKLNKLREEFASLQIDIGQDIILQQTFSGGLVSNHDIATNNPVELLNGADIALYAAKNSGRNCLLMFDQSMSLTKQQSKILIVDDDRFTRQILLDGLKDQDLILLEAKNGREALEIANEEFPNLILLDGFMPELNGYDVLVEIRKNIRFKQIAVIMLTGNQSDENIAKALNAGADDYITKPFSLIELRARINRFLVRHH